MYLDGDALYYADQREFQVIDRKDGKEILGFDVGLRSTSDDAAQGTLIEGMGIEAEEQPDGSVLVWFDAYAENPLPEDLELKLTIRIWPNGEENRRDEALDEITFALKKSEPERVAWYVPEYDGWIGDHVKVREIYVSFTKVRAYLTVDYDYDPRPEEEMGVCLHPHDAEGNAITTGRGSGGGSGDENELGFYRQRGEMQSFDEMPDVIVLDAKAIDGEPLGQCVCRLAKSE